MKDKVRQELSSLSLYEKNGNYIVSLRGRISKKTPYWDEARNYFGREIKRIKGQDEKKAV